ncbi:unnamed protein product [Lota lota]
MADLPIAPGQVYIEVEYDYEYKSKERLIHIQQGDCFLLVKKTNGDWWQVKKEEGSKAFYVPAQYVREVRKALMPPPKPFHLPGTAGVGKSPPGCARSKPSALLLEPPAEPGVRRHESGSRRSPSSPTSLGHVSPPTQRRDSNHQPPHSPLVPHRALADCLIQDSGAGGPPQHGNKGGGSDTLPRSRARSPDLGRQLLDSAGESLERRTNDSESGDELSGSSTEHLQTSSSHQGHPDSPVHSNLQELKITQGQPPALPSGFPLHTLGDWDTYRDHSGRHYYYNRSTQERTWKPPRTRDATESTRADGQGTGDGHTEDGCLSAYSSQSDSLYGLPACGWSEEMDAHGHTLYVSDYNNEKWIKHVDEQGRPYYYSADGSRSQWELPKYAHFPPQLAGDSLKSRSLDRKPVEPIVLTKWRHSTTFLEPNDKDAPLGLKPPSPDSDSDPSSPKAPASPSEKCGVLNVTKITEHGKKVRKNWTSSWTILRGSSLLFAKSQGGGTSWFGVGQSKPEFTVDLRGGSVDWASKDKSSKKNVMELKTRQATELLIQSDNEAIINDWFHTLQDTISTHAWESDEAIEEDMPESPGAEKQDKEKEHRDSKKGFKYNPSVDGQDKKTRHKLKKFLTRRPTLQSVRDKGYIKDQVFGCSMSSLCQRESTSVPSFVRMCIDHVEQNGLHVDGLYRVSGNLAIIQKLRYAVNHDEKVNLSDGKWEDIHVTAGALKMYFRELPEPLFTFTSFHDFVGAIKNSEYKQRVNSIKELVKQLPKPNHDTMQLLFKHLRKVIDHGEENRMTTQSVAIVFGPTLLRPETETLNMAVHMVYQNQIVELILLEYETIFGK